MTKTLLIHVTKYRFPKYKQLMRRLYEVKQDRYLLQVDILQVLIPTKVLRKRKSRRENFLGKIAKVKLHQYLLPSKSYSVQHFSQCVKWFPDKYSSLNCRHWNLVALLEKGKSFDFSVVQNSKEEKVYSGPISRHKFEIMRRVLNVTNFQVTITHQYDKVEKCDLCLTSGIVANRLSVILI